MSRHVVGPSSSTGIGLDHDGSRGIVYSPAYLVHVPFFVPVARVPFGSGWVVLWQEYGSGSRGYSCPGAAFLRIAIELFATLPWRGMG